MVSGVHLYENLKDAKGDLRGSKAPKAQGMI